MADLGARRVLVGLDASPQSLDALAAAAALAARLGAVLEALFVEDEDLLRLAALPFAGLVRGAAGRAEPLDRARAEAAMRTLAAQAREALERSAARHALEARFRVARGRVSAELLAAAQGVDALVLGAAGHGGARRGAFGATARATLARAGAPVLLVAREPPSCGRVVAVDDGTPAAGRSLEVARQFALGAPLEIVAIRESVALLALVDALGARPPALAVLPAGARASTVERLLALGVPVLLVR
jgi:nucleotide-binding universal stress UspA family protein